MVKLFILYKEPRPQALVSECVHYMYTVHYLNVNPFVFSLRFNNANDRRAQRQYSHVGSHSRSCLSQSCPDAISGRYLTDDTGVCVCVCVCVCVFVAVMKFLYLGDLRDKCAL